MASSILPLEVLRSFSAIAETGSVTRAAELIGRSQPALSLQLKRLEDQVGRPLFVRDANQLRLNDDGRRLLGYAQRMLTLNDEALAYFQGPVMGGRVRFGVPSEFASTVLPQVIGRFSRLYPGVTLEVTSSLSENLIQGYQRNEFDLILALHDRPGAGRKADKAWVRNDELVWLGNARALQSTNAPVPLVVAPEGCIYRKRMLQVLKQTGRRCTIVYTNPDLSGIAAAIDEGLGVTALARTTVPKGQRALQGPDIPELGSISVSLRCRRSARNPAIERLEQEVRAGLL